MVQCQAPSAALPPTTGLGAWEAGSLDLWVLLAPLQPLLGSSWWLQEEEVCWSLNSSEEEQGQARVGAGSGQASARHLPALAS